MLCDSRGVPIVLNSIFMLRVLRYSPLKDEKKSGTFVNMVAHFLFCPQFAVPQVTKTTRRARARFPALLHGVLFGSVKLLR